MEFVKPTSHIEKKLMKKLNDLLGEDLFEEWHDDIT